MGASLRHRYKATYVMAIANISFLSLHQVTAVKNRAIFRGLVWRSGIAWRSNPR